MLWGDYSDPDVLDELEEGELEAERQIRRLLTVIQTQDDNNLSQRGDRGAGEMLRSVVAISTSIFSKITK